MVKTPSPAPLYLYWRGFTVWYMEEFVIQIQFCRGKSKIIYAEYYTSFMGVFF